MAAFHKLDGINDPWKCNKHPSRSRNSGVCPTCLRDRLINLCPNCANSLPCPCFPAASTSSSSSPSSISRFSVDSLNAISRVSSVIESEPSIQRSRSSAVPFRSSRFADSLVEDETKSSDRGNAARSSTSSFWSMLGIWNKVKLKSSAEEEEEAWPYKMARSNSVSLWRSSESGKPSSAASNRGWHFPSPMKVFRHSKPRSPFYKGS